MVDGTTVPYYYPIEMCARPVKVAGNVTILFLILLYPHLSSTIYVIYHSVAFCLYCFGIYV